MTASKGALQKIRNFLIGKEYNIHLRYAADQAKRTQDPPNLPLGVAHKLSNNYYGLTRDHRRESTPPKCITKSNLQLKSGDNQIKLKLVAPGEVFLPV